VDHDKDKWKYPHPTNMIVLNYPEWPENSALWPIALTSYNNTGDAYPFTC
jgi:ribosomally synthesized peptide (two-chain TOMM family)